MWTSVTLPKNYEMKNKLSLPELLDRSRRHGPRLRSSRGLQILMKRTSLMKKLHIGLQCFKEVRNKHGWLKRNSNSMNITTSTPDDLSTWAIHINCRSVFNWKSRKGYLVFNLTWIRNPDPLGTKNKGFGSLAVLTEEDGGTYRRGRRYLPKRTAVLT